MKFNCWAIILSIILGVFVSLDHYGCLLYNKICVFSALQFPKDYYLQLSHFLGSLAFMVASSIFGFMLLNYISEKRILNWNKCCLLKISFLGLMIFWILLDIISKSTRIIWGFIAVFFSAILLYLFRKKILGNPV